MAFDNINKKSCYVIKDTPKLPYIDSNYVNVFVIDSVLWYTSATVGNNLQRAGIRIDMVVAARALAELRLVSVFALIPPPPTHHPPPTLTELSYFSAPCGPIWACEDIFW